MDHKPILEFESFLNEDKKLRVRKDKKPWYLRLLPNEKPYNEIALMSAMSENMYLMADLHIGDPIENWEEKRDKIISTINATVKPDEHLLILGDLSAHTNTANMDDVRNTIAMINCKNMYLILGNNDQADIDTYIKMGFKTVTDRIVWKNYVFSHMPEKIYGNMINIHGHIHEEIQYIDVDWHNHINVWDSQYKPIRLKEALQLFDSGYYKGVTINSKDELKDHTDYKYFGTEESSEIATESCKDVDTARKFVYEVGKLAKKYNANYFIVTDGASGISNNGNPAVKHARDCHIEWEKKHGQDPYEDWSHTMESTIPNSITYSTDFNLSKSIFDNLPDEDKFFYLEGEPYTDKPNNIYRQVMLIDDVPAGFIELNTAVSRVFNYVGVVVSEAYRNQGVATTLFHKLLEDYDYKSGIMMLWDTHIKNIKSQNLAVKLGFDEGKSFEKNHKLYKMTTDTANTIKYLSELENRKNKSVY